MSNEMIERVAKAIAVSIHSWMKDADWDRMCKESKDEFRKEARSAIEAMREPTDRMLLAGRDEPNELKSWQSMIDEVLR